MGKENQTIEIAAGQGSPKDFQNFLGIDSQWSLEAYW